MSKKSKKAPEHQEPEEELAPSPASTPAGDSEETPAPDTVPAPAPHPDTLSADHGFPSPRRCPPQE